MRFVYMDEAGTSANEPITMVVGLIVNADAQLMDAEAAIREVLDGVPKVYRDGFVFHADSVWNNPKYRPEWAMADRLALLKRMMGLPRRLQIPIAYGMVRRSASSEPVGKLSAAQYHHVQAFGFCVARADKHIREYAGPKEIGSIVVEDVPEMRRFLNGYIKQESEFRVSRIRKSVLFVEKDEDPLTQLSDAIAFGMRRYHSELEFGTEFATAIWGSRQPPPPLADFATLSSSGVYSWSNQRPA